MIYEYIHMMYIYILYDVCVHMYIYIYNVYMYIYTVYIYIYMGFPKMGVPLYRWMVYFMEHPKQKMDDN